MDMKNYESLEDALADLKKRGYEAEFDAKLYCLYCGDMDLRMNHDEFNIDEVYSFEKDTNPKDNAVLYAISSNTGVKGTMVDTNGPDAENMSVDIARKFRNHAAGLNQ
jgi:hypothetical protein